MKKNKFSVPLNRNWKKLLLTMKLCLLFLLISATSLMASSGYSQNTTLSIHLKNATLRDLISEVEKQSEFIFVFYDEVVDLDREIDVHVDNQTINKILDEIFKSSELTYRIFDRQIGIGKLDPVTGAIELPKPLEELMSVDKKLTGIVKDAKGDPIPGTTVIVKGTNIGTITDREGKFILQVPQDAKTLVFSFVGMTTQEIPLNDRTLIDVVMKEVAIGLEEVVVIGYGTQSRATLTTSVSKLDTKVLENVSYPNVASALQGTLSGVRVQTTSGMPGSTPTIIIRGGTSINNPDGSVPLYVVDGIIRNNINNLDQSEIESVQVLKDAAATSIYGARASNGIVIIVTKSGQTGESRIDYSYDLTFSNDLRKYDYIGAKDFIYYQRLGIYRSSILTGKASQLALLTSATAAGTGNDLTNKTAFTTQYLTSENEYKLSEGWESMPDPLDPTKTIIFDDFDFQKNSYQTGVSERHTITASGGTEKARYSAGLGYFRRDGIIITTWYKRLNAHLNGDFQLKDNLSIFGRLTYANSKNNDPTVRNTYGRHTGLPPTAKHRFEDGTLSPGGALQNLEYTLNTYVNSNVGSDLTMAFGAQWKILPGLSFDPQISWNEVHTDATAFRKAYWNGPTSYVTTRNASGSSTAYLQEQADAVFTYTKSFNTLHNLEAKAGFSYYRTVSTSLSASGKDAATDLIETLNASATPLTVSGEKSEQLIYGYFGRINYDFKQKYLLSVNTRYDGASNLGDSYKWGLFPGISIGWNMYKEEFWSMLPENLLKLKLRGSYGVNGNISGLGPYTAQGTYTVGSKYTGLAVVDNTVMANTELQWEQSKTLDLGMDLGIFDNRINIIFDVYHRITNNLLTTMSLPQSTGFTSTLTNLGSFENKGVDIELNTRIMPGTSSFRWDFSFNVSKVSNKILELPYNGVKNNRIGGMEVWDEKTGAYVWIGGLQEGGRVGDLYTYKFLGVYATDEEAASAPIDDLTPIADKKCYGGDVNLADLDGNGRIDTRDQVYSGNIYPTITGGFSNSFSYKNLSLIVRMDFTSGHTIYNYVRAFNIGQFQGDNGLSTEVLRSWMNQGDVTDIPRYVYADQQAKNKLNRVTSNSYFYEKGDFLAIRELTLTYDLPESLLQKVNIKGLRVYATGNNLHYFTKCTSLNPEVGGEDRGRYAIPRNIIFGLNLTL